MKPAESLDDLLGTAPPPSETITLTPAQLEELVTERLRERAAGAASEEEIPFPCPKRDLALIRALLDQATFIGPVVRQAARLMERIEDILGPAPIRK